MTEQYRIIYQNRDVGSLVIEEAEKILVDAPEEVRNIILAVWEEIIHVGVRQSGDVVYVSPVPVPATHRVSVLWLELEKYEIYLKSVK